MELHVVSYGIDNVARPFLLFFSSENRLLWLRYREYDLAHQKLIFEFCIYMVWKSVQYGARIRRIFLDGYGVLVFRIVIFKISSFKLQNTLFDVIKEPEALEEAPPSPDYVPGPEHPPSPDYVHGPEHPPSQVYVPEPKYPEYLVPFDAEIPIEDQPLPDDASPTALSSGYIADFDPEEDPKEDPEEDPVNYPADGGDDADDESSDDDDYLHSLKSVKCKKSAINDDDDNEEDEEEHSAPVDSFAIPVDDPVPSVEDTEPFETYETAPTPVPSPRRRTARMSVRPQTPMSATAEALIVEFASAPLPPPSPLSPLSSPLPQIPSPPLPVPSPLLPLPPPTVDSPTYIPSPPLLLPSTSHRDDIHEADLPPRKRLCLTDPTPMFEVGESSSAAAARQAERDSTDHFGWGQSESVLATNMSRDTHEIHVQLEDEQHERSLQRGRVNMLFRDRRFHRHAAMFLESEARHAREAWSHSMNCSKAVHAELQAYRAQVNTHEIQIQTRDTRIGSLETLVATLVAQTLSLQTQLTSTLGRMRARAR
ncbi:hypothetical protein Tco_1186412 [Tanacetum coccineum]